MTKPSERIHRILNNMYNSIEGNCQEVLKNVVGPILDEHAAQIAALEAKMAKLEGGTCAIDSSGDCLEHS